MKIANQLTIWLIAAVSFNGSAKDFKKLLLHMESHPKVKELKHKSDYFFEKSKESEVLSDPILKVSAQNLPLETLKSDQSPMSGFELSVSQSLPMNGKLASLGSAYRQWSIAQKHQTYFVLRKLKLDAWKKALAWKRYVIEKDFVDGNLLWLQKQLKVSNSLFSTGKVPQRAILEIEIRIANLEAKKAALQAAAAEAKHSLSYLLGANAEQELETFDPRTLRVESIVSKGDTRYLPLIEAARSQWKADENMADSIGLAKTPDLTIGLSYKKRSNIDNLGDFIGIFVSSPLSIGEKSSSKHRAALAKHRSSEQALIDLEEERNTVVKTLNDQLGLLEQEKNILKGKSLRLTKLARDAASKAYGIGSGSYNELLTAEIGYLETKIRINTIDQKIANHKIELRFARGEKLS